MIIALLCNAVQNCAVAEFVADESVGTSLQHRVRELIQLNKRIKYNLYKEIQIGLRGTISSSSHNWCLRVLIELIRIFCEH
jgi:hypothetical protein